MKREKKGKGNNQEFLKSIGIEVISQEDYQKNPDKPHFGVLPHKPLKRKLLHLRWIYKIRNLFGRKS